MPQQEPPTEKNTVSRRFSVAPMLDYTDRHCRYFHRLLTRYSLLYTEMITTGAIIHGDRGYLLKTHPREHPVALQLGGSSPGDLATCARYAAEFGYSEINLNCGCPSDRVQSGMFGAVLMKQPQRVAECFLAMQSATSLPVTLKHRIGVDEFDSYDFLLDFVGTVAAAGCKTFIVHARKAWLQGLSPKQNREIPPLDYDRVYRLKKDFPELEIILNGGVTTLDQAAQHLQHIDGVMIGREAYHNPYLLSEVDRRLFNDPAPVPTRTEVLEQFAKYVDKELSNDVPRLSHMTRHIIGLFQGMPGARKFRRYISENAHRKNAGVEVIFQALAATQNRPDSGS